MTFEVLSKNPIIIFSSNSSHEEPLVRSLSPIEIEYIPPLDFYFSPQKNVVIKRIKEKRRTKETKVPPHVVWDGSQLNEDKLFQELAHSIKVYANASVYHVTRMVEILKQKDSKILELEQHLLQQGNQFQEQLRL